MRRLGTDYIDLLDAPTDVVWLSVGVRHSPRKRARSRPEVAEVGQN